MSPFFWTCVTELRNRRPVVRCKLLSTAVYLSGLSTEYQNINCRPDDTTHDIRVFWLACSKSNMLRVVHKSWAKGLNSKRIAQGQITILQSSHKNIVHGRAYAIDAQLCTTMTWQLYAWTQESAAVETHTWHGSLGTAAVKIPRKTGGGRCQIQLWSPLLHLQQCYVIIAEIEVGKQSAHNTCMGSAGTHKPLQHDTAWSWSNCMDARQWAR